MAKRRQLILTTLIIFIAFCVSILINTKVFAGVFPVTPPITPPTPTASASPRPTPVTPPVTPKPNSFPVIITNKLALGKIGKFYIMSITGKDSDRKDNLKLSVTNLPNGIKLITCIPYKDFNENYISCIYTGIPKIAGVYPLKINLTDGKSGMIKFVNLKITK